MKTVGVLALQGDFLEHMEACTKLGFNTKEIRVPEDLEGVDRLIIPGGESTTISLMAEKYNLVDPLKEFVASGKPVWGTCAGLIFLVNRLGVLPVTIKRNFLGSQKNSFEATIKFPLMPAGQIKAMFIRPPQIVKLTSKVDVLANYKVGGEISPVAIKYKNILATTFHTELDKDNPLTEYFLSKI